MFRVKPKDHRNSKTNKLLSENILKLFLYETTGPLDRQFQGGVLYE
jgi:hypothetical protein